MDNNGVVTYVDKFGKGFVVDTDIPTECLAGFIESRKLSGILDTQKDAVGNGILLKLTRFPARVFYSIFSPNTPEKKLPTAEKKPLTSSNTLLVTSPTLFAVCAAFAMPTSCSCN